MLDKNDFWQIEQKLQACKKKYWKEGSKKLHTGEKTLKDANYVDVLEREKERQTTLTIDMDRKKERIKIHP